MIFQIDCQIAQIPMNGLKREEKDFEHAAKMVNYWAEKNNWDLRITSEKDMVQITTPENHELIEKILAAPHSNFELIEKN